MDLDRSMVTRSLTSDNNEATFPQTSDEPSKSDCSSQDASDPISLSTPAADETRASPSPPADDSKSDETKVTLFCSLPLEKVQPMLSKYTTTEPSKKPSRKICLYCDRTFVNLNLQQKHVERCHSPKQLRRVSLRKHQNCYTSTPCIYCDKFSSNEHTLKDLFKHLIENHSKKYFGCLPCELRFISSTQLAEHQAELHFMENVKELVSDEVFIPVPKSESQSEKKENGASVKKKQKKRAEPEPVKNLRSRKMLVKSSRVILKRSKRLQTKITETAKVKRSQDKKKDRPDAVPVAKTSNPYPEFDHFFQVKKITDHSIDNLKISSLTFDDVFDKAFFNRIKCNIQENLQNHIDGKLFRNEESENRISNFEKNSNVSQEPPSVSVENYGCEISLNAVAPTSLLLTQQLGDDPELQIEYGSKPSKKKITAKKDEVHYKYFTRRKYQASILEHKENRDLSKLDMWTQYVVKSRQQKIADDKKTPKEMLDYFSGEEYKTLLKREELNRILDRRGPFEDLKQEACKNSKKSIRSSEDDVIAELVNDILDKVYEMSKETPVSVPAADLPEIPSYLNLVPSSSLPAEIDRSDKITLICSSQETDNFQANPPRSREEKVELTGEWARSRIYVCAACGLKLQNIKQFLEHKSANHQYIWVQHYEFVGNQSELYRHLDIPTLGKVGVLEDTVQCKLWKRSEARTCTKCAKQCNSLSELHRHILECGGDWTWMLVRKKCKYRPFGSKSRRKRRGLVKRLYTQKTEISNKKILKKSFDMPRQKPSDAESIKRMLANLPPKRTTRQVISFNDNFNTSRKRQIKSSKKTTIRQTVKVKENENSKSQQMTKKKQNNAKRRSLRSLNKIIGNRMLDTNSSLMLKRRNRNLRTKQSRSDKKEEVRISPQKSSDNDSSEPAPPKRSSPRIEKLANSNKHTIKHFFPVKKNTSVTKDAFFPEIKSTKLELETHIAENKNDKATKSCKRKIDLKNTETSGKKKTKIKKATTIRKLRSRKEAVDPSTEKDFFECAKGEESVAIKNEPIKVEAEIVEDKVIQTNVTNNATEPSKKKFRKQRGLNDCIAMLTSKLAKDIEDNVKETECQIFKENADIRSESILKVPFSNEHFDLFPARLNGNFVRDTISTVTKEDKSDIAILTDTICKNDTVQTSELDTNLPEQVPEELSPTLLNVDEKESVDIVNKKKPIDSDDEVPLAILLKDEEVLEENAEQVNEATEEGDNRRDVEVVPKEEIIDVKNDKEYKAHFRDIQDESDENQFSENFIRDKINSVHDVAPLVENGASNTLLKLNKIIDETSQDLNGFKSKSLSSEYKENSVRVAKRKHNKKPKQNKKRICKPTLESVLHDVPVDENAIEKKEETSDIAEEVAKCEEQNVENQTSDEVKEPRRRSARNSKRVTSYNETDLIDPLLDDLDAVKTISKIMRDTAQDIFGVKRKTRKASCKVERNKSTEKKKINGEAEEERKVNGSEEKRINGDELFDLLKITPRENFESPKPTNTFFNTFDEISNDFNDENFDVLEDILEKSIAVIEENLSEQTGPNLTDNGATNEKVFDFDASQSYEGSNSRKRASKKVKRAKKGEFERDSIDCSLESIDIQDLNSNEVQKNPIFCDICNKSFSRMESLSKHRRTITHIQKLSELEAKEAALKKNEQFSAAEEMTNICNLRNDLNILDILEKMYEKPHKENQVAFNMDNHANLKLADIITNVLNKPTISKVTESFDKTLEPPEIYDNLSERKSFESGAYLTKNVDYFDSEINNAAAGTILEKQITLLENIIENRSSYVEDAKGEPKKEPEPQDTFLKPSQIEELSEDSLRINEEQKARKALNRDEELFLECCSLLKSGSELSNYSKRSNKVHGFDLKASVNEQDWFDGNSIQKANDKFKCYSDSSGISTPLGDGFSPENSNSAISSKWDVGEEKRDSVKNLTFEEAFHGQKNEIFCKETSVDKMSIHESDDDDDDDDDDEVSSDDLESALISSDVHLERQVDVEDLYDGKKLLTKGAKKIFEGLKVSIPTEQLNMEKLLTSQSPRPKPPKKNSREATARKRSTLHGSPKSYDIYDFEETQDNSDIFTKPDFRSFRNNFEKVKNKGDKSDNESQDGADPISYDTFSSSTSSVSEQTPAKKKTDENITKKKCMIMGRIFKNALKSKNTDEDIRSLPIVDNAKLVEDFVLNCSQPETMDEEEMNSLDKRTKKKQRPRSRKRTLGNPNSSDDEFKIKKNSQKRPKKRTNKTEESGINLEQELRECIGVASRKSQRKCTSGKQNVLIEYWSSDESSFEVVVEKAAPKEPPVQKEPTSVVKNGGHKEQAEGEVEKKAKSPSRSNRRKANPLYHWSSSSEDEVEDFVELHSVRDGAEEEDYDRPIQHGWIVGDSPKKLVTMLAQAKGKKFDVDGVKEQDRKRTAFSS